MIIFWRLVFGHLLADFTLQTNRINCWKRQNFSGMMVHCLTHPLCYLALTWGYWEQDWIRILSFGIPGWACILFIFLAHFLEDEWRIFTIFHYHTPDNTLYFVWDQIIHYGAIWAVVPASNFGISGLMPEKWPILGCLFVLTTHAATVFIYFVEKDRYDRPFPEFQEKYLTMLERLILALCFFIPGHIFVLFALAWFSIMRYLRSSHMLDLSRLSLYLGTAIAVFCGLCGRFIYYH